MIRPSVSRQAFMALYRAAYRQSAGARARNTMVPLDRLVDGTTPETRFEFLGTVSGGDESVTYSRWGWDVHGLLGVVRRESVFLMPLAKIVEVARG